MLGIGISELALILLVGLMVIGPKELPALARQIIAVVKKLRVMADHVRAEMHKVVEESGVNEVRTHTIIDLNGQPQVAYDVSELRATSFVIRHSSLEKKEFESRITNHES